MPSIEDKLNYLLETKEAIKEALINKGASVDGKTFREYAALISELSSGSGESKETELIERTITTYANNTITNVGNYAFNSCTSLTSVSMPNVIEIGAYAFERSAQLSSVTFPLVTTISSNAFSSCRELKTFDSPNLETVYSSAFSRTGLTSVYFPSLTSSVASECFYYCTSLVSVYLPLTPRLENYAFKNCTSLPSIELPNAAFVGYEAFRYCSALARVDLPICTTIGGSCFQNSGLDTLILRNTSKVCSLSATACLSNTPIASGTGYIYVPSALIEDYKVATNWVTYANQFRAIEDYPEICGV